jgi:hypothetical protein
MRRIIHSGVCCVVLLLGSFAVTGAEVWEEALAHMPLTVAVPDLNRTNCVDLFLHAFQSNHVVKALVFMPGATDEFYMFRRAKAALTNNAPSLLDAINALRSQTLIRATFRPPLLLLHSDEDPLEPVIKSEQKSGTEKLKQLRFAPHALYNDRDWDHIQPVLKKWLKADVLPWRGSIQSWHFYRHSFAGWNLSGWEALEAVALAGKTTVTIRPRRGLLARRPELIFEGDLRVRATPKLEVFPR